ncbi:hypothetical protein J6590_036102 [Homalodisca vitripennis]|nr:hypothetical protein J6590_036102 [Homalodisca vitripennis]
MDGLTPGFHHTGGYLNLFRELDFHPITGLDGDRQPFNDGSEVRSSANPTHTRIAVSIYSSQCSDVRPSGRTDRTSSELVLASRERFEVPPQHTVHVNFETRSDMEGPATRDVFAALTYVLSAICERLISARTYACVRA